MIEFMPKLPTFSLAIIGCLAAFPARLADAAEDEPPTTSVDTALDDAVRKPTSDAAAERRFEWNVATLEGDYRRIGSTNAAWDAQATEALALFARMRCRRGDMGPLSASFEKAVKAAIGAGCSDPLVKYLNARFAGGPPMQATKTGVGVHVAAAQALDRSQYAEIRKYYGCLRAAEALKSAYGTGTNMPPKTHQFRRAALAHLATVLEDRQTPYEEVHEACAQLMQEVETNKKQREEFFFAIEAPLFAHWTDRAGPHLLKGHFYVKYAWQARGSGMADTVTDGGWKLFGERLALAGLELELAWRLDPTDEQIPLNMMSVELGQGLGRERLETWFAHAMKLNPNSYAACMRKLNYLEPKWHGSPEEMLKFGRECLDSKEWGGRVPTILAEARWSLAGYLEEDKRKAYWTRPEVWEDGKASYETFFRRNPEAVGYRKYYARYAYRCERWEELRAQLQYIRPADYEFFGGKAAYDRIVQEAKGR